MHVGEIVDIGRRIELISMDPHFHDISIGLYCQDEDSPKFIVYSYSKKPGVVERLTFIREAMAVLAGIIHDGTSVAFRCGQEHNASVRRAFLEAGKLPTGTELVEKPLSILDKKSGLTIRVGPQGDGLYLVTAEGEGKSPERRIKVVGNGLAKLGEMALLAEDRVQFPCNQDHNALTGLLLVRAPNVRAIVREQEMNMSRGVLAAPSQQ